MIYPGLPQKRKTNIAKFLRNVIAQIWLLSRRHPHYGNAYRGLLKRVLAYFKA